MCNQGFSYYFYPKKYNQNNDFAVWYEDQLQVPKVVVTGILLISLMIILNQSILFPWTFSSLFLVLIVFLSVSIPYRSQKSC